MTEPAAWLILYGQGHRCVVLDRARAEQTAAQLHGVLVPLVVPDEHAALLKPGGGQPIERGL
jgi:hypothetical protein